MLTRRGAPFNFFHPRWPIYTHPRFLPATRRLRLPARRVDRRRGLLPRSLRRSTSSVVGIRTHDQPGARRSRRSVLLGADSTRRTPPADAIPLGIGRDVVLDRVIVDKNARIGDGVRLVNEQGVAGRRRRRLLHPQRHHHRAQGWTYRARRSCLTATVLYACRTRRTGFQRGRAKPHTPAVRPRGRHS